jgi:hypothetical protein
MRTEKRHEKCGHSTPDHLNLCSSIFERAASRRSDNFQTCSSSAHRRQSKAKQIITVLVMNVPIVIRLAPLCLSLVSVLVLAPGLGPEAASVERVQAGTEEEELGPL